MSSLFADSEFQDQINDLYQEASIWEGVRVLRHETSENKWESRQRLLSAVRGDPLWKTVNRKWHYLWETPGQCPMCAINFDDKEECQRCMECLKTVHQCCLFQDHSYERIPVCLACQQAAGSTDPLPPLPPPESPPQGEDDVEEKPPEKGVGSDLLEEDYFTTKLQERDPPHVNFMEWIICLEIRNVNSARRLSDHCIAT